MDEAVSTFLAFTGADDPSVAEYYLEACGGDVESAVHHFLENPPGNSSPHADAPPPVRTDAIDDMEIEDPEIFTSPQVSPPGHAQDWGSGGGANDDELQRALEESLRTSGGGTTVPPEEIDLTESPREAGGSGGGSSEPAKVNNAAIEDVTDTPDLTVQGRAISPSRIESPPPDVSSSRGGPSVDVGVSEFDDHPILPDDINVQEARMLEAAMLGVPFNGTLPDFTTEPSQPPLPPSPSTVARRKMLDEQDAAYEASLKADREKAEAAVIAEQQAKEEERKLKEQQVAEKYIKEQEEAARNQLIQSKRASLPPEPPQSDSSAIMVMIKLPDGSRLSRRFSPTSPLLSLFDFVDVETDGKSISPGQYNLVRQFPRKVFAADNLEGSLQDAGLGSQEAFFIDLQH